jgi:hypothetical protein
MDRWQRIDWPSCNNDYELLSLVTEDFLADALEDDEKMQLASEYTLEDVYDAEQYRDRVMVQYEYDFGDGWEHSIAFLGRENQSARRAMRVEEEGRVVCLSGEVCFTSIYYYSYYLCPCLPAGRDEKR